MKKWYIIGAATVVAVIVFAALSYGNHGPAPQVSVNSGTNVPPSYALSASSTPVSMSSFSTSSNPEDIVPGLYPNPIKNIATTQGLKISSILIENNTDAAGNAVSDHLQFTLQNLTGKSLSKIEAYYTVTDTANGKKEGYYKSLTGIVVSPHGSVTVHFDNQSGYGHFLANMHGIYGTTFDQLKFSVEASAPGYIPVTIQATKAPGGAEVVGQ